MKYIRNHQLKMLNERAKRHGMKSLTDNCPVIVGGYNGPIFLALPSIDTLGWHRCEVPTSPDCENHAILDIRHVDFERLPDIPSTVST